MFVVQPWLLNPSGANTRIFSDNEVNTKAVVSLAIDVISGPFY